MQRYRDASLDPLPIRSPYHEAERQRLARLTEEFLANGGQIEQLGHKMRDKYTFVIDARRTPVYAHLFQPVAEPEPVPAAAVEPEPLPQPEPEPAAVLLECPRHSGKATAARLMVQAALGASPRQAAEALGIDEKTARQVARDFHITFKRQR